MTIYANQGRAEFTAGSVYSIPELFAHSHPVPVTEVFPVAQNTNLAAYTVVGLSGGNLVEANPTANAAFTPIGIITQSVTTGAGQTASVAVFRSGNFRKEALVWSAHYNTDALRIAAFRGVPTPINIIVQ